LGWLLHRVRGGVVAGTLFVLPGALTVLVLSIIYVTYQQEMLVSSIFFGVKAAVLAIVTTALWRLARKILRKKLLVGITIAAFLASFVFAVPFPIVIVGAALATFFFGEAPAHTADSDEEGEGRIIDSWVAAGGSPKPHKAFLVAAICAFLWLAPIAVLYGWLGAGHVYVQEAMFFSKMAVVTFGGAYAVLSYMAQQTVGHYGWISAGEMLDGLGMAETTPGPLIMVTQFVGFMGAYHSPGMLDPIMAGCLGALVTTWVTFAPCFLWIFLGAPYIELLRGNRVLAAALSGITAAVVGVVLNLAIWFGLRVMFIELSDVTLLGLDGIEVSLPVLSSFDPLASAILAGALVAITSFGVGMIKVLVVCAAAGLALGSVGLV
ncbi:MAG: chromate transporter, partial [Pseudomonadota bacterium]|nr:chromate transporter [Pseudomonadota bacterium]